MKTLLKILPSILTIAGTFLIGSNLFGTAVNESLWQEIVGAVLAVAGVLASIIDHTASVEMIQAALRRAAEVITTLLIASGKATPETVKSVLEFMLLAVPIIYAYFSRKKTQKLSTGELSTSDLKK